MSDGQQIYETMRSLATEHADFEAMAAAYFALYPRHKSLYNIRDLLQEAWVARASQRAKKESDNART